MSCRAVPSQAPVPSTPMSSPRHLHPRPLHHPGLLSTPRPISGCPFHSQTPAPFQALISSQTTAPLRLLYPPRLLSTPRLLSIPVPCRAVPSHSPGYPPSQTPASSQVAFPTPKILHIHMLVQPPRLISPIRLLHHIRLLSSCPLTHTDCHLPDSCTQTPASS